MLKTNNLACGYGRDRVLENINLEIKPGEIFTLVGLNGSGKSTLLKTFLGLLPALGGDLEKTHEAVMLEANPSASFAMTVKELFQIRKNAVEESYLKECMEFFDIEDIFDRNILELSSGQAKRVWLGHLFSLQHKLILIDEPFAHLDWAQQKKLTKTIRHWQKKFATTFVLAAHELELLANLTDQMGVIAKKTLIATGTPEKVLTSKTVAELFAFTAVIDENPIDGTKRLTLGEKK